MSFPECHPLFRVTTLRAIEHEAQAGLPPRTLMQRAGLQAARFVMHRFPVAASTPILILAGPGNNGGDGFEMATHLKQAGYPVAIAFCGTAASLPADARAAFDVWQEVCGTTCEGAVCSYEEWPDQEEAKGWAVIVDALFGIGLARPITGKAAEWIRRANEYSDCSALKIALDVPSGLSADTGNIVGNEQGIGFRADVTLTFIGDKPGLHTHDGKDYSGHIYVEALGIESAGFKNPDGYLNTPACFENTLPVRRKNSHKGHMGNLVVVGGNRGMAGAVLLAGRAGLYAGAGRVFVVPAATPALEIDIFQPELMFRHSEELDAIEASIIVVGPGLGTDERARTLMTQCVSRNKPLLIDADGLNILASSAALTATIQTHAQDVILTPHPLEAARLLGVSTAEVQADRIESALKLATHYQAIVVLKGAGTVIARPDGEGAQWVVNSTGCPALSSAGTGDVLSGLIGGLVAQNMPCWEAVLAAVWIHGRASETCAANLKGYKGITASEISVAARAELNHLTPFN